MKNLRDDESCGLVCLCDPFQRRKIEVRNGARSAEQIALNLIDTSCAQQLELLLRLDALSCHRYIEVACERQHRCHYGGAIDAA